MIRDVADMAECLEKYVHVQAYERLGSGISLATYNIIMITVYEDRLTGVVIPDNFFEIIFSYISMQDNLS